MRKINENESFLEFYNSEKQNTAPRLIASILNAIYTSNYYDNEQSKHDIEQFANVFKKENEELFYELQDLPIFKLYGRVLQERVINRQQSINDELTPKEKVSANLLSNKLFNMKRDFAYSISIDEKSYSYFADNKDTLEQQLKILLHNKNGVIVFYVMEKNCKYMFGFVVKNHELAEVEERTLSKYNKDNTVKTTTMQKFLKEIYHGE